MYKCNPDGSITALQAYSDADVCRNRIHISMHPILWCIVDEFSLFTQPEENFYTCAWTYDTETGESLLAIAGFKGIIRIIGYVLVVCS